MLAAAAAIRNTFSKCGSSGSSELANVPRKLRNSASAKGKRPEITRAFSSNSSSNSGNNMQARASSGLEETVEGTSQPSLTRGSAGATGWGAGLATGRLGDLADGEPSFKRISAFSERVASVCSESVQTAKLVY